jgi:DNA gyrase subunit B
MPELIANGFLYIAQPPLYKVTRQKKDTYLKDNGALDEYLLRFACDHARVTVPSGEFTGEKLKEMLKKVITYQERLGKLAARRDPRVVDALVQAARLDENTLLDLDRLNAEVEKMHSYLQTHAPDVLSQLKVFRKDDPEHQAKKLVLRTSTNGAPKETVLDYAFLSSPEYRELLSLRDSFDELGRPPYRLHLDSGEVLALTIQQLLAAVRKSASTGIVIQRYKGLGEMSAEQLWDTTMNPSTRTLLQVKVDDGVEADEIFSLLMGEAVEPRREFIERNALDVQNLDI